MRNCCRIVVGFRKGVSSLADQNLRSGPEKLCSKEQRDWRVRLTRKWRRRTMFEWKTCQIFRLNWSQVVQVIGETGYVWLWQGGWGIRWWRYWMENVVSMVSQLHHPGGAFIGSLLQSDAETPPWSCTAAVISQPGRNTGCYVANDGMLHLPIRFLHRVLFCKVLSTGQQLRRENHGWLCSQRTSQDS